ncbi:MAG: hypothetical protein CML65_18320 [Rhodobacteraceae bacterium]|nr:hypothetical protein [Paracoccaceae bacterium]
MTDHRQPTIAAVPAHVHHVLILLTGLLMASLLFLPAPQVRAQTNTGGTLNPIWRNEPVIGIWLSGGQGLIEVPAYLDGTDFPYARRPYPLEVPFADRLTVVRLLGGWDRRDLGKGESRGYETIARADLVTRAFGAPTLRTTDLADLGSLDCDEDTRRCTGQLHWTVPEGDHLLITAVDLLHICADADGTQRIDGFEIGTQYTISVRVTQACPADTTDTAGDEIGSLSVDPSRLDYHFDLLKPRLDPYVAQGYTDLTLVLDNIPWALPQAPTTGAYGQTAPPASLAEWTDFLDQMITALIDDYGADTVGEFRFRLGTEQQSKKRFSGTPQQYLALYEATVAAIRARLPHAEIGPFNQAGSDDDPTKLTYAFLYDNIADPDDIDFVAHSLYYIPQRGGHDGFGNTYPSQRLPAYQKMWATLPVAPDTPIEFQEFGVLRNADGARTSQPGARGAARHAADIFALLAAGVNGLWHWSPFERLRVAREKVDTQVLNGRGWLYLVLEHFLGGTIYDVSPPPGSEADPVYSAHYIDTEDAGALVVSAFNLDQAQDSATPHAVTITVPKELLPDPSTARFERVSLSQDNAVYDRIRADLAREGLLNKAFAGKPGQPVGDINGMGGFAARRYVAQHWEDYRTSIIDSLTRKPITPKITEEAEAYRITLQIPAPSVFVLLATP